MTEKDTAFFRRTDTGVTLVELVVALAVLAVVLTIAIPSFINIRDNSRVKVAAEAVYAYLQFARSECIKQGRDLYVRVKPSAHAIDVAVSDENWCLGIDNAAACDCVTENDCQFGAANVEYNLSHADFSGIALNSNMTSSDIKFESRRGTSNAATITVTGADAREIKIKHSTRGRVMVCSNNVSGYSACP